MWSVKWRLFCPGLNYTQKRFHSKGNNFVYYVNVHDDDMGTSSALLATFCWESTDNRSIIFTDISKWITLMVSLLLDKISLWKTNHYSDVTMASMAPQIIGALIAYSMFCSSADQINHQSFALLALCEGNSPVTGEFPTPRASDGEMFPFDDVIVIRTSEMRRLNSHVTSPLWCSHQLWYQSWQILIWYTMMTSFFIWEHFSRYWPFVRGIHRSPVNSPHNGQWRGALMFFFDKRMCKQLSKPIVVIGDAIEFIMASL